MEDTLNGTFEASCFFNKATDRKVMLTIDSKTKENNWLFLTH